MPNDKVSFIPELRKTVRIGDLFSVRAGKRIPTGPDADEEIPVIRGADLSLSSLSKADLPRWRMVMPIPEDRFTKINDILLQSVSKKMKTLVVGSELEGCFITSTIVVLRPLDSDIDIHGVSQSLSSPEAMTFLRIMSSDLNGSMRVSLDALSQLEIRLLPSDVTHELQDAEQLNGRIRDALDDVLVRKGGVFSSSTTTELQANLTELRAVQKVVASSLDRAEDIEYRISNFYPLPIAYPYRVLQGEHEPASIARELCRNAESLVAYLTAVALSLAHPIDKSVAKAVTSRIRGKGASFGGWLSMLDAVSNAIDENKGSLHCSMKNLLLRTLWVNIKKIIFLARIEKFILSRPDWYWYTIFRTCAHFFL